MGKTKYEGMILENRWKVIGKKITPDSTHKKYILENIYNRETMTVDERTFKRIVDGETTVNGVRAYRLGKRNTIKFKRKKVMGW